MRPIPEFLSHLPTYRGFPVPFFVPKDDQGRFQFKYASQKNMDACVKHHKCCICFTPLIKKEYYFISGPRGFANKVDSHPPMHKRCAEYSLQVCPHLYFEKTQRTTDEDGASWQLREKPNLFFLVHAKKFTTLKPDRITLLVRYSSVVSAEKFIYENSELIRYT